MRRVTRFEGQIQRQATAAWVEHRDSVQLSAPVPGGVRGSCQEGRPLRAAGVLCSDATVSIFLAVLLLLSFAVTAPAGDEIAGQEALRPIAADSIDWPGKPASWPQRPILPLWPHGVPLARTEKYRWE